MNIRVATYHVVSETYNIFSCNTKIIIELKKFKNILEPRVEKHTFPRTIQEQIKFKNISRTFKDFKDQWPPGLLNMTRIIYAKQFG